MNNLARQPITTTPHRERRSWTPDEIIDAAIELAEELSVDGLTMKVLSERLGISVSSICWHFHKKDDLILAVTKRANSNCVFPTLRVEASQWRQSLSPYASESRKAFLHNPILIDLILMRAEANTTASPAIECLEQATAALVNAGLSAEQAAQTLSAVVTLIQGSAVLERVQHIARNRRNEDAGGNRFRSMKVSEHPFFEDHDGRQLGLSDDRTFEYGLRCVLDQGQRLIETSASLGGRSTLNGPGGLL